MKLWFHIVSDVEAWACWSANGGHGFDAGRICGWLYSASHWCVCYAPIWNCELFFFYQFLFVMCRYHFERKLIKYHVFIQTKRLKSVHYNLHTNFVNRELVWKLWIQYSKPRCWICLSRLEGKLVWLKFEIKMQIYIYHKVTAYFFILTFENKNWQEILYNYCTVPSAISVYIAPRWLILHEA